MTLYRFIWTQRGLAAFERGATDPRHTISNVERWDGFVRQMRAGCPWLVVDEAGRIVAQGTGQ